MNQPLVKMESIEKSFPGVKALDKCHFELNAGEVHALVGENGAGKTTLMKILTGVFIKDAGTISLKGKIVDIHNPRTAQQLGISIIYQEFNLIPHLSVAQNIFIGREPASFLNFILKDKELNKNAQALLDQLHLNLDPKSIVSTLTVAKQQMVEIAKALSYNSEVLIMDEPTAALTDTEIDELFTIIHKLKEKGVGIVYISHRMDELKRIANRVTVMRDGNYIDTMKIEDITIEQIISMMVGRKVYETTRNINENENDEIVLSVRNLMNGRLVNDVSFDLKKGEILGFAGLMGAGRTEVARTIFGADHMTSGEIFLHGKKVSIKNPWDAIGYGIGYLSEDRKQFGVALELDVETNIVLASLNHYVNLLGWVNTKATKKEAEERVALLNIKTPSIKQKVKNLSGGNQQKVVIGKWLTNDCDILIFDEPTRGIDVGAKNEIYKLLNKLVEAGKSIIMISSELPEILRMSHRIVVMCEGKITGIVNASEANSEKLMHYATKRKTNIKLSEELNYGKI